MLDLQKFSLTISTSPFNATAHVRHEHFKVILFHFPRLLTFCEKYGFENKFDF